MVPKLKMYNKDTKQCFRAVLFRMVPKHEIWKPISGYGFRAVLFRMVPKPKSTTDVANAMF